MSGAEHCAWHTAKPACTSLSLLFSTSFCPPKDWVVLPPPLWCPHIWPPLCLCMSSPTASVLWSSSHALAPPHKSSDRSPSLWSPFQSALYPYSSVSSLDCKDEPLSLPHELPKTLLSVGLSSSSWASAPHLYLTLGFPPKLTTCSTPNHFGDIKTVDFSHHYALFSEPVMPGLHLPGK